VPLTNEDIETAVRDAERIVTNALPLGAVDTACRPEREAFRERAFTEVLRVLLGNVQPG
jgi:hypothetical protein